MSLDRLEREDLGILCLELGAGRAPVPPELDRKLAQFYSARMTEAGDLTLGESRGGSFSKLLRLRAERGFVLRAEAHGAIRGVASVCVRPGYMAGEIKTVAFLGDLRIEFERDLLRGWRKVYGDLLEVLETWPDGKGVSGCLTAVVKSDERSIRALVEPHRLSPYLYSPMGDFSVVSVLGHAPLGRARRRPLKRPGFRVVEADAGDLGRVIEFLDTQHRQRAFGISFATELPRRLREWPDFSMRKFLIVEDGNGRIRGATAPWNPADAKRWYAEKIPTRLAWLGRTLARLPRTSLYRPPRIPREGDPVDALFLTHLELDFRAPREEREAWLAALIDRVISRHAHETWNALVFVDFNDDSLQGALRGLYCHSIGASLYSVHGLGPTGLLRASVAPGALPPAFELCVS